MICCFFSSIRRHTRGVLVTGVQTCALPILAHRQLRRRIEHIDAVFAPLHREVEAHRRQRRIDDLLLDVLETAGEVVVPAVVLVVVPVVVAMLAHQRDLQRSEEHTSELQSLMRISYAVFCLKKKKTIHSNNYTKRNKKNNSLP